MATILGSTSSYQVRHCDVTFTSARQTYLLPPIFDEYISRLSIPWKLSVKYSMLKVSP
jgi:hypothetical protein